MKSPIINIQTRRAVELALARFEKNGEPRDWNQSIHALANGYAALDAAQQAAADHADWQAACEDLRADVAPPEEPDAEIDPLAFAKLYGANGFLGNCSQFAQALARLDVTDGIYVKRSSGLRDRLAGFE